MITWILLHPKMTPEHLGYIPQWLDDNDPRDARAQLNAGYVFGGWSPMEGFKLTESNCLMYPGDPPLVPLAMTTLREELVLFYDHAWVVVVQPDRSFEACRMD